MLTVIKKPCDRIMCWGYLCSNWFRKHTLISVWKKQQTTSQVLNIAHWSSWLYILKLSEWRTNLFHWFSLRCLLRTAERTKFTCLQRNNLRFSSKNTFLFALKSLAVDTRYYKGRTRLTPDPCVGVSDLQKAFEYLCKREGTWDLHAFLIKGKEAKTWKNSPCAVSLSGHMAVLCQSKSAEMESLLRRKSKVLWRNFKKKSIGSTTPNSQTLTSGIC